jgi:hypothetical protein
VYCGGTATATTPNTFPKYSTYSLNCVYAASDIDLELPAQPHISHKIVKFHHAQRLLDDVVFMLARNF